MIKVEQTEFDTPFRSNCLSACVASIFEIVDLNLFENVHDHRSLWRWLTHRFPAVGVISRNYVKDAQFPLCSRMPEGFTDIPGVTPWIAVVNTTRTPYAHHVVMVADRLVWDPHPLREMGVGDQIGDYVFTLNRPEKLAIHEFLT